MKAKKVVMSIVGILVLQMLLSVGGSGVAEAKEPTEEEQTLYIAMQMDMPNFNYFDLASNSVWKDYVLRFCFDSLSGLDPAGNIYPALAESWEFDQDNLKVTVHLRQGVKFHDGTEMTADDVVFSYTVLRDGTTLSSSIIDAFDADGDGKVSADEIAGTKDADGDGVYEGVKKIDDYTVEFTMAKPYGQFFLSTLGVTIIPKHIWQDHLSEDGTVDTLWGTDKAATIGTGPFYYAGGKDNVYRELKVFEDYWGKNFTTPSGHRIYPTEVKRIYYKLYTSLDTAILALKTDQVDYIPWAVTPGYVPDLLNNPKTDIMSIADNGYFYLAFNQKREPMNILAFRKAVSHCIDKETIVQRYMGGYGQAGDSVEPPFWTGWYNSSVKHYPYSINTAKQVLRDAGFTWDSNGNLIMPNGKPVPPLVILTPPADYDPIRIKAGEMIANNLKKIGIDASAKPLDFDVLVAKMNAFDYDMLIIGWSLSSDPIGNIFDILGPKASQNYFAFWSINNDNPWYNKIGGVSTKADAETQRLADLVQTLGEKAKTSFDREEQIYYTKWAQGVISEAVPVNVLYYRVNNYAVSKTWNGWVPFMGEIINGYSVAALSRSQAAPQIGEEITALLNINDKIQYGAGTTGTVFVFDKNGAPVEGASVSVQGDGFTFEPATGTTDANGTFTFTATPTQTGYLSIQITATSGENSFSTQKTVSVVKGKPDVLFLTASPEKVFLTAGETDTITLKVTDQTGAPVEGAQVILDTGLMGYGTVDHDTVTTGSDGTAQIVYTAPSTLPLNKHAEVRLSLSASKEGYGSDYTSTVTQYVVVKNTEPSQWQYIKVENVSTFTCNNSTKQTTVVIRVLDQDGSPLSGQTISLMYSNPEVLSSPPESVDTNETGYATFDITFADGLVNTTATQIWMRNLLVTNGIGAGLTILYKGTNVPDGPVYGGIIEYDGTPILDPDSGEGLTFTVKLYDLDGNQPSGTVPVALIIGEPPQGSTAAMENPPDYIYSSLFDYAGIQVFTSLDNGAISTGGYFLSDLYTNSEINELNDGLYDSWQSLQDDWWTFVDYENMKAFNVVDGVASFNITPDDLVLSDSMPSIIVAPMAKSGFYVTPDYSNFYWEVDGTTAFKTDFVIQRTQKMVSVKYEMDKGFVKDMEPGNSFDVNITVIDQNNTPVEGAEVDVFVQAYGTGSFFNAEVAGNTDEAGKTTATVSGKTSTTYRGNTLILSNLVKQPLYIKASVDGFASVFASTEIFNSPVELFATISGPMKVEYDGTATYTLTVVDGYGNAVEGAGIDISVDVGAVSPVKGTTDASGAIQFTYTADGISGMMFTIPTIKTGATKDGYGAVSLTYKLLAYNVLPKISIDIPSEGVTINETSYTITGTVDNPSDVSNITITLDNGEPIEVTLSGNTFTYTFTNLSEGDHTITVTIVDSQGVTKTYQYKVTVQKPGGGGANEGNVTPANTLNLVKKYAPTLYFDSKEKYFPTELHGDDFNVTNNHENYDRGLFPTKKICYYHITPYDGFTVYQYWYYYTFNNYAWIRDYHEHDFEAAFVWVDNNTGEPFYFALTMHHWINEYQVSKIDDLKAYVERSGHGMSMNKRMWDGVPMVFTSIGTILTADDFTFIRITSLIDYATIDLKQDEPNKNTFKTDEDSLLENPYQIFVKAPWLQAKYLDPENVIRLSEGPIPNILSIHIHSPVELQVYDTNGHVTGVVDGIVKSEIPYSGYVEGKLLIMDVLDNYTIKIVGIDMGKYNLSVVKTGEYEGTFNATNIPITENAVHQYTIDWQTLSSGGNGVTIKIDNEGDGTFETTITSDEEFTDSEYINALKPKKGGEGRRLLDYWWVFIVLAVVVIAIIVGVLLRRKPRTPTSQWKKEEQSTHREGYREPSKGYEEQDMSTSQPPPPEPK